MNRYTAIAGFCFLLGGCATQHVRESVPLPPAPQTGEPTALIGLGPVALRAEFGAPAFVRHDGIAQLWRYDGAACHAFFFLYDQGGKQAVRHVETLPAGSTRAADQKCLNALRVSPKVS